ncbi:putative membrane protein [Vibrio diabolicus E0666]|nr:putative membrane protein [Vibrio diabolicus E0666]
MTQLVKVPIKVITITVVLSLIVAIPVQILEFGRLKYIAENNGYSACPPFTIASSGMSIEAMVKDERLCLDAEINRIAVYGYFHELERIDNYIKSQENYIQ